MIRKTTILVGMAFLVLLAAAPTVFAYQNDYGEDVANVSNPSPTAVQSNVNDYKFQDEQINLTQDSGVVRVLRTSQKALVNDFVTAVITLKNASPRELRGLARTICRKEGGDADTLWDWYNRQTGQKIEKKDWALAGKGLVVVCPRYLLPKIQATLTAIDKSWVKEVYDGSWVWYYKGKNRDVRDIIKILRFYATPDGDYDIDVANNAILRSDQPCIKPLFMVKGINEVDIPLSRITLDTQIYEVDTNDEMSVGVDFQAWKNGPGARLFRFAFMNHEERIRDIESSDWARLSAYDFLVTSAYVDFMQTKGKAKLLTDTALSAVSGTFAAISTSNGVVSFVSDTSALPAQPTTPGITMPQFTPDSSGADSLEFDVDTSGTPKKVYVNNLTDWSRRTLSYQNTGSAGVTLAIAPVVGLESAEMDAVLGVTEFSGYTPTGEPIVATRSVSSRFEVKNNQPIVMGGLCRTVTAKTVTGIPYLCDIPYVGQYVFGKTVDTKTQKRLTVLMKPHFQVFDMDAESAPKPVAINRGAAQTMAQGDDVEAIAIPGNSFGYDQWLLDSDKERGI
jgi:hypothetical protein